MKVYMTSKGLEEMLRELRKFPGEMEKLNRNLSRRAINTAARQLAIHTIPVGMDPSPAHGGRIMADIHFTHQSRSDAWLWLKRNRGEETADRYWYAAKNGQGGVADSILMVSGYPGKEGTINKEHHKAQRVEGRVPRIESIPRVVIGQAQYAQRRTWEREEAKKSGTLKASWLQAAKNATGRFSQGKGIQWLKSKTKARGRGKAISTTGGWNVILVNSMSYADRAVPEGLRYNVDNYVVRDMKRQLGYMMPAIFKKVYGFK